MKKKIIINKINIVKSGYTLIEIMIVVAIIAMLAGLVLPRVMGRADDAAKVAVKQDIATISSALKLYRLDNARYPTTEQGLKALVEKPTVAPLPRNWKDGGYLEKIPKDPWGNEYQYITPGIHSDADIFTYGKDKEVGGEGINADVGNWE
ncbi:MAG: hypothetical protein RLZZ210_1081 [Pseudomonadota bacterium]|jgi:general secretion pathway protein G